MTPCGYYGLLLRRSYKRRRTQYGHTSAYTQTDSPGGSTGPAAELEVYDCLVFQETVVLFCRLFTGYLRRVQLVANVVIGAIERQCRKA